MISRKIFLFLISFSAIAFFTYLAVSWYTYYNHVYSKWNFELPYFGSKVLFKDNRYTFDGSGEELLAFSVYNNDNMIQKLAKDKDFKICRDTAFKTTESYYGGKIVAQNMIQNTILGHTIGLKNSYYKITESNITFSFSYIIYNPKSKIIYFYRRN